jgi:tetratricopeptide (TPR) repeat protein
MDVTLYAVPWSLTDRAPRGVLAIVGKGGSPTVSRCCQPYGQILGRSPTARTTTATVYLPVDARLDPEVTEAELAALLDPGEAVYLLHPAAGFIRFEPADAHGVADLIRPPPPGSVAWDRAAPGVVLSRRLLSIEPESTPSPEMIIDEGRSDIASQQPSLEELSPSPGEPLPDALGRPGRAVQRLVARVVQWLTGQGAKKAGGAKQAGGLAGWAQRQLARIDQAMLASRHREILRLLHLLQTNPDEGLRYALPLRADDHRGQGTPGSKLPARNTDFNLRRLAGGGPVDRWNLAADFRNRLIIHYHDLASRELRLGRHRRAAYIYAELLGNLELAASALKTGRHWREAAVLYRERLRRPEEAAHCLEQGGLWTEAIAIYGELGNFEQAGDLYMQLDQTDNARNAYRRAVDKHLAIHDYLAAARLLENKLSDGDQAIACLEAGWPSSPQAGTCLEELFQLWGRLGRHQAAQGKVDQLRQGTLHSRRIALVGILSRIATIYPDQTVRDASADATRTIAAECLPTASAQDSRQLLADVRRLLPADRLLGRDCDRYLRQRFPPAKSGSPAPKPQLQSPGMQPTLIREIRLSKDIDWQCAISAGDAFYAAGYRHNRLELEQGFWEGRTQRLAGEAWPTTFASQPPILLACGSQEGQTAMVHPVGGLALPYRWFPATDELPLRVSVGTPPGFPGNAIAAERTPDGTAHVLAVDDDGLVLHSYDLKDEPLGSRHIAWSAIVSDDLERPRFSQLPAPFHVREGTVYVGLDDRLVILRPRGHVKVVNLPGRILGLHGSRPWSRARVVAALEQGAVLYWDDYLDRCSPFATELLAPALRFIEGGWLVAASAEECHVYRTGENYKICWEANLPHRQGKLLAVLPTARPNQFALFGADGTVALYQVPRRLT